MDARLQRTAHDVIARFFELPVHEMGGGLRIVSLGQSWLPVEERDLIVKAVQEYAALAAPPQPDDFTRGWVACQRDAKAVIENHSIMSTGNGPQLAKRGDGDVFGLTYADAISALPPPASAREG